MDRRYSEDNILLILNYDTNGNNILTLTERCQLHIIANDFHWNRPEQISDELKGKIAVALTEINHTGYRFTKTHYAIDREKNQLLLIKTF